MVKCAAHDSDIKCSSHFSLKKVIVNHLVRHEDAFCGEIPSRLILQPDPIDTCRRVIDCVKLSERVLSNLARVKD